MRVRADLFPSLILIPAILCLILSASSAPSSAAWPADGILACNASGQQYDPMVVPDGAGGMILVWQDERTGTEIFAQRLDGSGTPMWTSSGVDITTGDTGLLRGLVTDEAGGAIIVWEYPAIRSLSASRIDPDGNHLWGTNGVPVGTNGRRLNVATAPDGSGGALIAWTDDNAIDYEPYIQRIDAGGNVLWGIDGMRYSSAVLPYDYTPDLISDGAGGALIAYITDDPNPDAFVQRVYANETVWSVAGTKANYSSGIEYPAFEPAITLDGAGGVYVAWQRDDPGALILVQKIDPSGDLLFTSPRSIGNASGEHKNPDIISDGMGGACVVWESNRNGDFDIYAQRIDASATPLWTIDGLPVCEADYHQFDPVLVTASSSEFIMACAGEPVGGHGSGNPLYSQKISFGGATRWGPDAIQVLTGDEDLGYSFAADGSGGLMAVISQDRILGSGRDIYAQSINCFGVPAAPEPVITDVSDVPDDQGGWLRLTIGRSDRDHIEMELEQVAYYDIWQRIDDLSAPLVLSGLAAGDSGPFDSAAENTATSGITLHEVGSHRFIVAAPAGAFPTGTWEFIGSFGASQTDEYVFRASTLADMVGTAVTYSVYTVAARTSDPSVWFVSAPDSGYSIDNLSPAPPSGLAGEQSYTPEGLSLTWNTNLENDFWYYAIHRGTSSDFVPGTSSLVATPQSEEFLDDSWTWESGYFYKVSAFDIHGNESGFALLGPDMVTGDDPMPLPEATFLAQNYPNPFNPNTTIAFGLKAGGFVNLSVYDAAGRLVATLINESRPAGQYAAVWNGNTENGSQAASGVYFYKLVTEEFAKTRKMILLR